MSLVDTLIVLAMLAQGGIAMLLLMRLGAIRVPLVMRGKVDMEAIALSREPWPEGEKRVSNAFDNQFQLPVLFYLCGGLSLLFGAGVLEAVLGWAFVLSRIVHAAIFAITNNVRHRFAAYTMGYAVLIAFWLDLAVRLAAAALHPVA